MDEPNLQLTSPLIRIHNDVKCWIGRILTTSNVDPKHWFCAIRIRIRYIPKYIAQFVILAMSDFNHSKAS